MVFWGAALDLPTVVIDKESFERPPPEAKSTGQNSLMKSSFSALWQKKKKKKRCALTWQGDGGSIDRRRITISSAELQNCTTELLRPLYYLK